MSAFFVCKAGALHPHEERAAAGMKRLGDGEVVEVEIVRPRCLKWHKFYKAVCQRIGENQDPRRDGDSIDYELRILAGHYDVIHSDGFEIRYPKRIAFAKLSAEKWEELFPSLDQAIRERFGDEYLDNWSAA